MEFLNEALGAPVWSDLGKVILHFLWQGAALALCAELIVRSHPRATARLRYAVYCLAFLVLPVLPLVTYLQVSAPGASLEAAVPAALGGLVEPAGLRLDPLALLAWLWLVGVCVQEARLMGSYLRASQLRRRDAVLMGESWQVVMRDLGESLGLRRCVRVYESARVRVPALVGWLEPVVLVPVGALISLSPEQLKSVLAHELAHLRRFDPWINALQSAIESLLFFHPAVWWLSTRIREEREYCCDDLAVEVCGDSLCFARALSSLESLRGQEGALILSSTGGSLMYRIQRLVGLDSPAQGQRAARISPLLLATAFLGLAGGSAYGLISSDTGALAELVVDDSVAVIVRGELAPEGQGGGGVVTRSTQSAQEDTIAILESELASLASQLAALRRQQEGVGVGVGGAPVIATGVGIGVGSAPVIATGVGVGVGSAPGIATMGKAGIVIGSGSVVRRGATLSPEAATLTDATNVDTSTVRGHVAEVRARSMTVDHDSLRAAQKEMLGGRGRSIAAESGSKAQAHLAEARLAELQLRVDRDANARRLQELQIEVDVQRGRSAAKSGSDALARERAKAIQELVEAEGGLVRGLVNERELGNIRVSRDQALLMERERELGRLRSELVKAEFKAQRDSQAVARDRELLIDRSHASRVKLEERARSLYESNLGLQRESARLMEVGGGGRSSAGPSGRRTRPSSNDPRLDALLLQTAVLSARLERLERRLAPHTSPRVKSGSSSSGGGRVIGRERRR